LPDSPPTPPLAPLQHHASARDVLAWCHGASHRCYGAGDAGATGLRGRPADAKGRCGGASPTDSPRSGAAGFAAGGIGHTQQRRHDVLAHPHLPLRAGPSPRAPCLDCGDALPRCCPRGPFRDVELDVADELMAHAHRLCNACDSRAAGDVGSTHTPALIQRGHADELVRNTDLHTEQCSDHYLAHGDLPQRTAQAASGPTTGLHAQRQLLAHILIDVGPGALARQPLAPHATCCRRGCDANELCRHPHEWGERHAPCSRAAKDFDAQLLRRQLEPAQRHRLALARQHPH